MIRADAAAGAGAALDDERLAELLAHAAGQQPRDAVDPPAGGEGNDDTDGLGRIGLSQRLADDTGQRDQREKRCAPDSSIESDHRRSSPRQEATRP
jgi:hypothetical protein